MIILISGCSHTGKTLLAQRLLEKYKYPYLSIDHLKMGLIRSKETSLTPEDDDKLTEYLWPIICEIIKTAIENKQNLIVEGLYIPYDYKRYFSDEYLLSIEYICLVFSQNYIEKHYDDIIEHRNVIECRLDSDYSKESMIVDNINTLNMCKKYNCRYTLIEENYQIETLNLLV